MTLTMIQLTPDVARLMRWAHGQGLTAARSDDDLGYALHAALAATFGTNAPKPFRLLSVRRGGVQLLGYTAAAAGTLRDHAAACAEPAVAQAMGLETLAAKMMPSDWKAGARYGFEVRVRPMIRTDRDGDREKSRERDVFLKAVDGLPTGTGPSRGEVYAAWLRDRLRAGGAELEAAVQKEFRLTRTLRRDQNRKLLLVPDPTRAKKMGGAGFPDVTFTGKLAVREPDAFGNLLARGVGRHRAFGFGMLLLRPAD